MDSYNGHKAVSLADQVFDRLEGDILGGKYKRDDVLTELGLCRELGVSRTPVREALRRLEQEHIIKFSGKGSVVVGITRRDIEDIYAIRLRIEGLAARGAAENITEEGIAELREAIEFQEFYLAKSNAERIKSLDSRFHEGIYNYSGSDILRDTLHPLHKKAQMMRKLSVTDRARAEASVTEHKAIFDAIASGNGELAEALMCKHIENAKVNILKEKQLWE